MILPHLSALNARRIVLASASPRRREILQNLGLKFETMVSTFEEDLSHSSFPAAADYAVETARHKAVDVARMCASKGGDRPVDLIISADTVVEHKGRILEKASDVEHAREMLTSLSGSTHHVHTGVVLLLPNAPGAPEASAGAEGSNGAGAGGELVRAFSCTTEVVFDELSADLIQAYIESGEPFGKAGSYGIQGLAGSFVRGIDGCYFNVVGFPVNAFSKELLRLVQEGYLPLESSPVAAAPAAVAS